MANDLRIKIKFDADTKEISLSRKEIEQLGSSIKKGDKSAQHFGDTLKTVAGAVGGLYAIKMAFDGIFAGMKELINVSATFERLETVLGTIEGSSQKAEKSMKWITDFTASTPYQLEEVTQAFVKLRAYGIDPTDGTLRTLGDTAAAMGKSVNDAVEAIADAVVGENERLKEFGIRASVQGDKVAYSWTDASGKAKHVIVQNNAQIIQSTLNAIFNSKYVGAMEQQSKTWSGMMSNMADNWTLFKKQLMDAGAFDYIKAAMMTVADTLKGVYKNTLDNTDVFTEGVISAINGTIHGVGVLANAFQGVAIAGKTAGNVLIAAWDIVAGSILKAVEKIIDAINLIPGVKLSNEWSKKTSESLFSDLEERMTAINSAFDGIVDYEKLADQAIAKTKKNFADLKRTIGTKSEHGTVANAIAGAFTGFSSGAKKAIKDASNELDKFLRMTLDKETLFYRQLGEDIASIASLGPQKQLEYYEAAVKKHNDALEKSAKKTSESAKTVAEAIYDEFEGTARHMTGAFESFFDYTSDKFMDFGALAKNVLDEVYMSITRALVIEPLVKSITGVMTGGAIPFFASGGVIESGNVTPFATGGVVASPTLFPMANGAGLMGEAGPEAIMPLARTSSGDLGVKVQGAAMTVNNYVTVQAQDGKISNESLNQLMTKLAQTMDRSMRRNG